MTNGEKVQKDFDCEVCEPIMEDDIIHVIFSDKKDSAIGFDWSWWIMEYKEPTTKNDFAQERYQDLIEYFGDEKVAKIILEDRKEFKAWIERLKWHVKKVDELARELEQIKGTANKAYHKFKHVDSFTEADDDFYSVLDTAKEMGMNVNENTPINFKFIVELIRRLKEGRQ